MSADVRRKASPWRIIHESKRRLSHAIPPTVAINRGLDLNMFDDIAEIIQIRKGDSGGANSRMSARRNTPHESRGLQNKFSGRPQTPGIQVEADNTASRIRERLQIPSFVTARFQHAACVPPRRFAKRNFSHGR